MTKKTYLEVFRTVVRSFLVLTKKHSYGGIVHVPSRYIAITNHEMASC